MKEKKAPSLSKRMPSARGRAARTLPLPGGEEFTAFQRRALRNRDADRFAGFCILLAAEICRAMDWPQCDFAAWAVTAWKHSATLERERLCRKMEAVTVMPSTGRGAPFARLEHMLPGDSGSRGIDLRGVEA